MRMFAICWQIHLSSDRIQSDRTSIESVNLTLINFDRSDFSPPRIPLKKLPCTHNFKN